MYCHDLGTLLWGRHPSENLVPAMDLTPGKPTHAPTTPVMGFLCKHVSCASHAVRGAVSRRPGSSPSAASEPPHTLFLLPAVLCVVHSHPLPPPPPLPITPGPLPAGGPPRGGGGGGGCGSHHPLGTRPGLPTCSGLSSRLPSCTAGPSLLLRCL